MNFKYFYVLLVFISINFHIVIAEGKTASSNQTELEKSTAAYEKSKAKREQTRENDLSRAFINDKNNTYTGLHEIKTDNGIILSQVNYINGKKNGKANWYDYEGNKELEREYKNDLIDGIEIEWIGKKRYETFFKNGKKDGHSVSFDDKNKKTGESNWKNGKQDGIEISYNDDGSKNIESNWKNGKKDGVENVWMIGGNGDNIRVEAIYKNGKLIDETWHRKKNTNNDITTEIKDRCLKQMGEHGYALVKVCVDEDLDALTYIAENLDSNKNIAVRCLDTMKEHGYSLVKVCIQQDIAAKKSLDKY